MGVCEQVRLRDRAGHLDVPSAAAVPGGALTAVRREGATLLAALDAVVRERLSGDSEVFLRVTRQEMGE